MEYASASLSRLYLLPDLLAMKIKTRLNGRIWGGYLQARQLIVCRTNRSLSQDCTGSLTFSTATPNTAEHWAVGKKPIFMGVGQVL